MITRDVNCQLSSFNAIGSQKIGALAFVYVGDVDEVWELLKPILTSDLQDFADYYERTWTSSTLLTLDVESSCGCS